MCSLKSCWSEIRNMFMFLRRGTLIKVLRLHKYLFASNYNFPTHWVVFKVCCKCVTFFPEEGLERKKGTLRDQAYHSEKKRNVTDL